MANPTTNFGWVMPTSTDLVTDLPADFAVFGQGVDTTMAGLKGGTTGQILSKTSATDMAFTWITNDQGDITGVTAGTGISGGGTSGDVTITNTMATAITTAGDLIRGTGSGTFSRLGIGSTGDVLTVASGQPSWAAPISGGMTVLASGSIANSTTGFSLTSISGSYNNLQLVIRNSYSTADVNSRLRFNNVTTNSYGLIQTVTGGTTGNTVATTGYNPDSNLLLDNYNSSKAANTSIYVINIYDYAGNAYKTGSINSIHQDRTTGINEIVNGSFGFASTTAISRIDFYSTSAFTAAGTYTLYGVK